MSISTMVSLPQNHKMIEHTLTQKVGGEILDMALARAKPHARFVMCGAISQYNKNKAQGPKVNWSGILEPSSAKNYQNYLMIISMRIRMEGFIVFDYDKQFPEARKQLAKWLSEGKLKRKETVMKGGLAKAEQALVDLFNGANTGKDRSATKTRQN